MGDPSSDASGIMCGHGGSKMVGIPYYIDACVFQSLSLIGTLGLGPHIVPTHERSMCAISTIESMGLTTLHGIPSRTWMPIEEQFFGVEDWDLCWVKQKTRHNYQRNSHKYNHQYLFIV